MEQGHESFWLKSNAVRLDRGVGLRSRTQIVRSGRAAIRRVRYGLPPFWRRAAFGTSSAAEPVYADTQYVSGRKTFVMPHPTAAAAGYRQHMYTSVFVHSCSVQWEQFHARTKRRINFARAQTAQSSQNIRKLPFVLVAMFFHVLLVLGRHPTNTRRRRCRLPHPVAVVEDA